MDGKDIRLMWQRIIALEARVAELEEEEENCVVLGEVILGPDSEPESDTEDVGFNFPTEEDD